MAANAPAAAPAANGIRRPTVIDRPGSYALEKDILLPGTGAAIEIRASDVSLDLAGHRILGPGGRRSTGVAVIGASKREGFQR